MEKLSYILSPSVKVNQKDNKLYIGMTKQQWIVEDKVQQQSLVKLLEHLLIPRTLENIETFITIETKLEVKETLETLTKKRLIVDASIDFSNKFNSRDWLFNNLYADPIEVQAELAEKSIAIIGCGGIGSHVAVMLRQAGIGKLILIDSDDIELSNLSRQMIYQKKSLSKSKAATLQSYLQELPIEGETLIIDSYINKDFNWEILGTVDAIAVCCDDMQAIKEVNKYAYNQNIPYMLVGYINEVATWGPLFIPNQTGCFECFSEEWLADKETDSIRNINLKYLSAANSPLTLISASQMSLDLIKYLGNFGKAQSIGRRIAFRTEPLILERQPTPIRKACSVCCQSDKEFDHLNQLSGN